ncbi:hypothetical protein [Rheinheimera gaetbuli]
MVKNEIKTKLIEQLSRRADAESPAHIDTYEHIFEQLLERIGAPEDLAGFYYVANSLVNLLQPAVDGYSEVIGIDDNIMRVLKVDISGTLGKNAADLYKKNRPSAFWASKYPLYYLLFAASGFKQSREDQFFLTAFVVQFLTCRSTLEDPAFQPARHSRTEEVCRAFRQLQDKRQIEFDIMQISENIERWHAGYIAFAIEGVVSNSSNGQPLTRVFRTLLRFFTNNWSEPVRKIHTKPRRKLGNRGGMLGRINPDVKAADPIQEVLADTDEHGIVPSDSNTTPSAFSKAICEVEPRSLADNASIGAIFDPALQSYGAINITRYLRKKNNLNLSSRQLLSAGSIQLVKNLCKRFFSQIPARQNEAALAIYCVVMTGISVSALCRFKITKSKHDLEEGILVTQQGCYWRLKHRHSAKLSSEQPDYFYASNDWALTPCSVLLDDYCTRRLESGRQTLFTLPEKELGKRISKLLKRSAEKLKSSHVSLNMLEQFISCFVEAADSIDPVVLDFSYQQDIYATRVSRSYANLNIVQRLTMLRQLWRDIADYALDDEISEMFVPKNCLPAEENNIGSRFVPTAEFCRRFIAQLQSCIRASKPPAVMTIDEIVHYHNCYVRYVAWMLGFGTGYRAVHNPLPSLALHISEQYLLTISDKDDDTYTHTRVVAVAPVLNQQLLYLEKHIFRLAHLLSIFEPSLYYQIESVIDVNAHLKHINQSLLKKWFSNIRNSRTQIGPLFYLEQDLTARPVSPTWLQSGNGSFAKLPVNMGRHWLKSALLSTDTPPELINWQMGHWHEGQSPLFEFSSMNMTDCVSLLAPKIELLMQEQGWKAWKSDLI